jgi:hypothetical protein
MFDHELNPLKAWPSPHALDKALAVDEAEDIISGMVAHIDPATSKAKPGCSLRHMGLFAFPNQQDFDVTTDVGNIMGGTGMFLVASGGWELESTEFKADTYAPGDTLKSDIAGGDKGLLQKGVAYTDACVGVVSDGQAVSPHGKDVLRFWSVYLPATP